MTTIDKRENSEEEHLIERPAKHNRLDLTEVLQLDDPKDIALAVSQFFQSIKDDRWRHRDGLTRKIIKDSFNQVLAPLLPEEMRGKETLRKIQDAFCQEVFISTLRAEWSTRDEIVKAGRKHVEKCFYDSDRIQEEEPTDWLYVDDCGYDVEAKEMDIHWTDFIAPHLIPEELEPLKKRLAWACNLEECYSIPDTIRESFHVKSFMDFTYVFDELELDLSGKSPEEIKPYFEKEFYPLCWSSEVKEKVQGWCEEFLRRLK